MLVQYISNSLEANDFNEHDKHKDGGSYSQMHADILQSFTLGQGNEIGRRKESLTFRKVRSNATRSTATEQPVSSETRFVEGFAKSFCGVKF